MKLIVAGATGLVGSEIIRQALRNSDVTEVIALARKPVAMDDSSASKLKSVVIRDYAEYPDEVKAELAGADACIWYDSVHEKSLKNSLSSSLGLWLLRLSAAEASISQKSSGYARTARWLDSRGFMKLDLHDHFGSFISVLRGPHKIRHRDRSS